MLPISTGNQSWQKVAGAIMLARRSSRPLLKETVMNRIRFLMGAGLLLAAAPAFADDPAPPNTDPNAATPAPPPAGSATASPTAAAGEWPQAVIDQSYVVNKGKIGAYGELDVIALSSTNAMGMSSSATGEALHVGGAFGLVDKVAVGVDYLAPVAGDVFKDMTGKGPLAIFGMYSLKDDAKMHIAVTADFTANLCGVLTIDATSGSASCSVTKAIHAGLGARYNVTPKIAVFTGAPIGPGPVGQQLDISLESSGPITFGLPVGVGLQATPQLFAYVQPMLASFYISNAPMGADSARFWFTDKLGAPTTFGAFFAMSSKLQLGASLYDDLKHAGDIYSISLGARFYN
jgi:hypothetical protein